MIYTFYSFKGGVGRSMALANIAELLYQHDLKVLMVDWDLEAPGLERFFFSDVESIQTKPGVIDMIIEYKKRVAQATESKMDIDDASIFGDFKSYLISVYSNNNSKGSLFYIPAGRRSDESFANYAKTIRTFDWQEFYRKWEGELYFEWLRKEFENLADIVLIDSRTGVTEMGGVCTYQLADVIVMFCAANKQNIEGTQRMAHDFTREEVKKFRNQRDINLLILPARIDDAEGDKLNEFKQEFLNSFKIFVPEFIGDDATAFWQLKIPYIPYYSYRELIAVKERELAAAEDLFESFNNIVQAMSAYGIDSKISSISQFMSPELYKRKLGKKAEKLYKELNDEERYYMIDLLTRIIRFGDPDEKSKDVPRQTVIKNIRPVEENVINLLNQYKIISIQKDEETNGWTLEFTDESIISGWKRLRNWIEENRNFLLWRQQLQDKCLAWKRADNDPSELLRGIRLSEAEQWLAEQTAGLNTEEKYFIQTAIARRDKEQQKQKSDLQTEDVQQLDLSSKAWTIDFINKIDLSINQKQFLISRWVDLLFSDFGRVYRDRLFFSFLRFTKIILAPLIILLIGYYYMSGLYSIRIIISITAIIVAITAAAEDVFRPGKQMRHLIRRSKLLKNEGLQYFTFAGPYKDFENYDASFHKFIDRIERIIDSDVAKDAESL